MTKNKRNIVRFTYSYPYESGLLKLSGHKLTETHSKEANGITISAQKVWDKYEREF